MLIHLLSLIDIQIRQWQELITKYAICLLIWILKTIVTFEYPYDYEEGMEKYYPVNDDKNNYLSDKYKEICKKEKNVIFGGRLAEYKYYDMDDVIKIAMERYWKIKNEEK